MKNILETIFSSTRFFWSANTDNAKYVVIIRGIFVDCDIFGLSYRDNGGAVGAVGAFQTEDFLLSDVFLECLHVSSLLCFWSDC